MSLRQKRELEKNKKPQTLLETLYEEEKQAQIEELKN